ncbi:MAG: hypothetical protein U0Z53_29065 [Blastocatellia bacterium]
MRGTLLTLDTLASENNTTVAEIGEDRVFEAIDAARVAHNELVDELTSDLVEVTTDRLRRFGGNDEMEMEEVDEMGTADAQKITTGQNVGFPLRLFQLSVQWSRKYFQNVTGAEFARQFIAATTADLKRIERQIKTPIFTPTNSTFSDKLVDGVELPLKALLNADGVAIPQGPGFATFDGTTHTHYLATASLTETALKNLIETVIEHRLGGDVKVYINRAQESAVRALSGFEKYFDARIIPSVNQDRARGELDQSRLYDRAIGVFEQAEIWVKPWIPTGYMFCWMMHAPKPLCLRVRRAGEGLAVAAEDENYPLRARTIEREFGVSVNERSNGAVLYIGGGSYVTPVIN